MADSNTRSTGNGRRGGGRHYRALVETGYGQRGLLPSGFGQVGGLTFCSGFSPSLLTNINGPPLADIYLFS